MKRQYLISFLFIASALFVISCQDNDKKSNSNKDPLMEKHARFDENMERTAKDTAEVLELTKRYFDALHEKRFDEALSMLYSEHEKGSTNLTSEEKNEITLVYKNVPVLSYVIGEIKMYSEEDTEVHVIVTMFENNEGENMPNTIEYLMHPKRISGEWKLSVPVAFKETGDSISEYDAIQEKHVEKTLNNK